MKTTPETDSNVRVNGSGLEVVPASYARKLERERNAAIEQRDRLAVALEKFTNFFDHHECSGTAEEAIVARERWYVRPELLKLFPWCNAKEMSSADKENQPK